MKATYHRILFVDDDELILRSIDRALRRHAEQASWELHFVTDGELALELLEQQPFDVILVDAQMPRMSGSSLLRRVQESNPSVVRILLSGHTGLDVLRDALPLAHQFIAKPCDAQLLKTTLENACGLRNILERPELRTLVGGNDELPSAPRTYVEIKNALLSPRASTRTVAEIVDKGPWPLQARARTGQLRLLRTPPAGGFDRRSRRVPGRRADRGDRALDRGCKMFPPSRAIPDFSIDTLQRRSALTGQLAKRLLGLESGSDALLIAACCKTSGS